MTTLLYNPDTGEIKGGFKPPFICGKYRSQNMECFYVSDSQGKTFASFNPLEVGRAETLAAILNEYCRVLPEYVEMKKKEAK